MAKDEIIVDGRELLSSIRIGVRMPRAFGVRVAIATYLFELAGWVSGTTVEIEVDDDDLDAEPAVD